MAKEKIETLAVLDYLTLLPNRSGLYSGPMSRFSTS